MGQQAKLQADYDKFGKSELDKGAKVLGFKNYAAMEGQKNNNFRRKIKTYDVPNLTKFRYGLTARVGYANFYLNFFYSLTPLFIEGRGTEAVPISIGIGVSPF